MPISTNRHSAKTRSAPNARSVMLLLCEKDSFEKLE